MNISPNVGSARRTRTISPFPTRITELLVMAVALARRNGCPIRQPSPKNEPASRMATTASLPCSEATATLTSLLDVKDRVRGGPLREDNVVLPIMGYGSAAIRSGEKHYWIKFGFGFLCHGRSPPQRTRELLVCLRYAAATYARGRQRTVQDRARGRGASGPTWRNNAGRPPRLAHDTSGTNS